MNTPKGKLISIGGAEDKGTEPENGYGHSVKSLNFFSLAILKRFVDNSLPDKPSLTIEETLTKNYFYKNEEIKLVMLDTAGQSEYTPALPNRYCIGR